MADDSILAQGEIVNVVEAFHGDDHPAAFDVPDSTFKINEDITNLFISDSDKKSRSEDEDKDKDKVGINTAVRQVAAATNVPRSHDIRYIYNMNHKHRGMALIVNNYRFDAGTEISDRTGTNHDGIALCRVFSKLEFDVRLFNDLSRQNIIKLTSEVAGRDHKDSDCFVFAILTHGESGQLLYGTDGEMIEIDDIVAPFKGDQCPSLAGKPKLFFFQACQGTKLDDGVEVTDSQPSSAENEAMDTDDVTHKIPTEADVLLAYSVVPGYFSWRNSARGSWFIQSLCQVLDEYGTTMEMMRIMTRVQHQVANKYESNALKASMKNKKQMPCTMSMLTKELYFTPKKVKG